MTLHQERSKARKELEAQKTMGHFAAVDCGDPEDSIFVDD